MEIDTCENCGAQHAVEYASVMFRDRDREDCHWCGERLRSWSSSSIPRFKLVNPGDPAKKSE